MRREEGFAVIEMLLAMAIVVIGLVVANYVLQGSRPRGPHSEAYAVGSVRTILAAQLAYQDTYPSIGIACTLAALGPPPKSESPSAQAAGLIDPTLAGGIKSGYVFTITECDPKTNRYRIGATPQSPKFGHCGFCSDQSGVIRYSDDGGAGASCSHEI